MPEKNEFFDAMGEKVDKIIEKKRRYYFNVENENVHDVVEYLFNKMGCRLSTATATELYKGIEVLYHFSHDDTGVYYCPRIIMTDKENPQMNSITPIVRGAEWIEREMAEMYGIDFDGHPRKEPLLTKNNPNVRKQPLRNTRVS